MAVSSSQVKHPSTVPIELSFPLPRAPETKVHLSLTINTTSLLLFLTTVYGGEQSASAALGSFVYALPDVSLTCHQLNGPQLTPTASKPRTNYLHTTIHLRIVGRVHNTNGQTSGQENRQTSLCRQFYEFCKCRYGWYSGGGDGGIQKRGGDCCTGSGKEQERTTQRRWR